MARRIALLVTLLAVLMPLARADQKADEAQARVHFTNGRALYDTGNYDEAMREFALGFELVDNPVFLLNIGLCHYRLGHLVQARDNYQRFLRAIPADHGSRKKGEELLAQVEADLAHEKSASPPPPSPPRPPPTVSPLPPTVSAPPPTVSPPSALTASAPPRKPWIRRNWWVIPVVTVAAGGAAVGLALGLTRNNVCSGAGACVAIPAQ